MTKNELNKVMREELLDKGYAYSSGIFYKKNSELSILIELQRSRWGKGIYVNVGATPSSDIVNNKPPSAAHWGIQVRGEMLSDKPFSECFRQLAIDDEGRLSADAMVEPLNQLVGWLEIQFADPAAVRSAILDPNSWISKSGIARAVIKKWAGLKIPDY